MFIRTIKNLFVYWWVLLPRIIGALADTTGSRGRPDHLVENHTRKKCAEKNLTYFAAENSNQTWCCECPPGFHMEQECIDANDSLSECKPCEFNTEIQTFTYKYNHFMSCNQSRKSCDDLMNTELKLGSPVADSTCQCKIGYYRGTNRGYCKPHTQCIVGFGVSEHGNETSDNVCVPCKGNMFSDVISSKEGCKSHSQCKIRQRQIFAGNSTSDVICVDVGEPPTDVTKYQTTSKITATTPEPATSGIIEIPGDENYLVLPVTRGQWAMFIIGLAFAYTAGKCGMFERIWKKLKQIKRSCFNNDTSNTSLQLVAIDEDPLVTDCNRSEPQEKKDIE